VFDLYARKTYLDHLNSGKPDLPASEYWLEKRWKLFNELMFKISSYLRYGFRAGD
jgi:hypothetical protein